MVRAMYLVTGRLAKDRYGPDPPVTTQPASIKPVCRVRGAGFWALRRADGRAGRRAGRRGPGRGRAGGLGAPRPAGPRAAGRARAAGAAAGARFAR